MKNITETVKTLARFGNLLGAALEDGKINLSDVRLVAQLPEILIGAFSAVTNAEDIREEFRNLDGEKITRLKAAFQAELDIPNDDVERTIEQAADILDTLWDVYQAVAAFAKALKK
jgi:hypothetical protein